MSNEGPKKKKKEKILRGKKGYVNQKEQKYKIKKKKEKINKNKN